MRILAMGDFHGKVPRGLKSFIKRNKVDLVLSPGDFYGGVHTRDFRKIWYTYVDKIKRNKYGIKNVDGLKEFLSQRKFKQIVKSIYENGKRVLKYLDEIGLPVIVVKGNVDNQKSGLTVTSSEFPIEDLVEKFHNIEMLEYSAIEFNDYRIIGFGAKFPFIYKGNIEWYRKRGYEKIAKNIQKLRKKERKNLNKLLRDRPRETVVLSHGPPYNTKLDLVKQRGNPAYGRHLGDDILASAIKKHQPLLNVCGHMHENQGKVRIGKTLVVNCGYGKKGEFALIDLKGKKIRVELKKSYK